MAKTFLFNLGMVLLLTISPLKADQLAWLTKDQAQMAQKFLKKQKQILLFCACCSLDSPKTLVIVEKVYIRNPEIQGKVYPEYWEVVVVGTTANGQPIEEGLDLAYVHIKQGVMAKCLGILLELPCDPCTSEFEWS